MTKKRSPMELEGTRRIVEEDKLQKEKPLKKKFFLMNSQAHRPSPRVCICGSHPKWPTKE
jgi:hypothetical protein